MVVVYSQLPPWSGSSSSWFVCHKTIRRQSHLLAEPHLTAAEDPLKTCQIQFYLEHIVGLTTVSVPSSVDKHQASGIDQVTQVKDEVDTGEHSHCHALIPRAQPVSAAWVGPLFRSTVVGVKVEDGPDDGGRQIEDHSQHGIGRQEAGKWEGETAGALTDTEYDDGCWQDEADAVDRHAVLKRMVTVVQYGVADKDENDAGHKGLADLQQAWGCGHVAGHLARTRLADAHLTNVGNGGQAGEDSWHNAIVVDLASTLGALEVVKREDDGGRQAEQGGVAGEGDREVLPGNRGSGLKAKQLHQENKESAGKTEGPAEDAPITSAMGEIAPMHGHREGHTGEDQGCQPCPEEGAGLEDYSHDERCSGWREKLSQQGRGAFLLALTSAASEICERSIFKRIS